MARPGLTGVLLVGGASSRFGAPKALARLGGETLAERAWRVLGEACGERIAVGKAADRLELPFPVLDDGSDVHAPIVGLAAGLRAAPTDLCVVLPVDCPRVTPALLLELADACRDAARTSRGPLPGAYRRRALPALEAGELAIHRAIAGLDVAVVEAEPALLVNVNTLEELAALEQEAVRARPRC
ncbi:MAG TPA: molybdenum cofactor guanylyltransferase [Gaiellaceae bacterium]|nr:molybdenum cofactor guanylyltransferase [Gaiellaceae bacterium]